MKKVLRKRKRYTQKYFIKIILFIIFIEAELFTFTIQVENNGPSDATNVAVQLSNTKSYGVRSAIYNKDVEVSFMILKIDFN